MSVAVTVEIVVTEGDKRRTMSRSYRAETRLTTPEVLTKILDDLGDTFGDPVYSPHVEPEDSES